MTDHATSILMYSHDGFGLGHLKRNFNIAKKLVQDFPNCHALLLMGHTSIPFHPIPYGIDFLKLPSIVKVNNEQWTPRALPMDPERFKEFRSTLIRNTAEYFAPDLLIVDYVPKGVWGELMPTLEYLKKCSKKTKIVLGLRDIIDDPEKTRQRWTSGHAFEVIKEYYDQVLIYGSQEIYDTAKQYGFDRELLDKTVYCGYLCSGDDYKPRKRIRDELRLKHQYLVVVTAGGGGDAFQMMKQSMDALEVLQKKVSVEGLFITGPLMKPEDIQYLETRAEELQAKVITSADGILSYMNAADLLVTMGSYNTMMEAVRLGRPTIVIPREGPSVEQSMRAEIFDAYGLVRAVLDRALLEPGPLAGLMETSMIDPRPAVPLNMAGLDVTVKTLSRLMQGKNVQVKKVSEKVKIGS